MSTSLLLKPPSSTSPETTLAISQAAPNFLSSQRSITDSLPWPLSLIFSAESPEKWTSYENVFLACLRTGDNENAFVALEALKARFGNTNERVLVFDGMYREAVAGDDETGQQACLKRYEAILKEDPTLFAIRKRRAALLRSMGRTQDAVTVLVSLVDASPTDAEAWNELADLYLTQGAYEQATYCLEEVLLGMPNAWNMHARLGEVLCLAAENAEAGAHVKTLSESVRRFCRSVELCNDYLRGYYGLQLTTTRLLAVLSSSTKSSKSSSDAVGDLPPMSLNDAQKLNELATSKLGEIVRRGSAAEPGWDGYSKAELIAARELLDRDTQGIQR